MGRPCSQCESTSEFPPGGASRGSCEAGVWPPCCRASPAPMEQLCSALSSRAPPLRAPCSSHSPSLQSPVERPQATQDAPCRLCSLCQAPSADASSGPSHLGLTAALSGPSSPPAPSGPPLPPEAFLVPATAAPHHWSPRNQLPWGHRPRGDAGPRGPRRDLLLLRTQGHLELTLRPRICLRWGLGAGPDTSKGWVVRRVSGQGKGHEPRN